MFGTGLGGDDYPGPALIYAASPRIGHDGGTASLRALETVQPLGDRLGLMINQTFGRGDEAALAAGIRRLHGVVPVCWEHKLIARALVPALLDGRALAGVPGEWDSARFDLVLRLDRTKEGWAFRQQFPRLLAGDSAQPMATRPMAT